MSIKERIISMVPFEVNEAIELEGHEGWFVDSLTHLNLPISFCRLTARPILRA